MPNFDANSEGRYPWRPAINNYHLGMDKPPIYGQQPNIGDGFVLGLPYCPETRDMDKYDLEINVRERKKKTLSRTMQQRIRRRRRSFPCCGGCSGSPIACFRNMQKRCLGKSSWMLPWQMSSWFTANDPCPFEVIQVSLYVCLPMDQSRFPLEFHLRTLYSKHNYCHFGIGTSICQHLKKTFLRNVIGNHPRFTSWQVPFERVLISLTKSKLGAQISSEALRLWLAASCSKVPHR